MKQIILLRHAKTEPYDYNKDDFERNLTERGIDDCQLIIDALKQNQYIPNHIISSPANRTKQTSELFAKGFNIGKSSIDYIQSIYDGMTTQNLIDTLSKLKNDIQSVLFIGHNPDITRFAYRLTDSFEYYVPTCCAITLETTIDNWTDLGNNNFLFKGIFIPKNFK